MRRRVWGSMNACILHMGAVSSWNRELTGQLVPESTRRTDYMVFTHNPRSGQARYHAIWALPNAFKCCDGCHANESYLRFPLWQRGA